jgi:(2R)-sulfolactate sulfo-lyase subunit alpha
MASRVSIQGRMMSDQISFLAHAAGDAVAVAVRDCLPGPATLAFLDSSERREIEVSVPIPLGHKVALVALAEADEVIEYGERIGLARTAIAPGDHVHVHNIRSARWQLTS